ncbi:dihydroorotase [Peptacetobacter hiranonis]|uniref:Dihydroorotase n=1 Tax=Peptacetobacter hiranonis (strain DSM 13275 / JCM 10541 / KCTC 15199 / TO-931) TaxID=500633 RepID=B6FZQ2_PEPHT|nr:dihydroorotase [Peptacetobacter hiranonis]EEA84996.1 dihydroorotase [Peptacetobacter hiranonis DSM 13275]QEK20864.1 Dihydroorotase [Peptacetobacter hiranonis]
MILIKNGRLVNPATNTDEVMDVAIENGKILKVEKGIEENGFEKVIDAAGKIVAPGLIDVHVHFRDPGFEHKEDLLTGSASAAKGGFTTVVCMANTKPVVDSVEVLNYVQNKAELVPINIVQAAAITKGFLGKELVDMKTLKEAGALGFTDDGLPINDTALVMKAMEMAKELDVPLSFHEEDPSLIGNPGVNAGEVAKELGLVGAPNVAEDVMVARDCMMAMKTGAKVDIQHISSGNSVDMVRFAKQHGARVYAEASPHHFTLTEDAVREHKTFAKMNPPLRTAWDRDKIIEGLKDNTIEIIATDHAPHTTEEKTGEFQNCPSGIIGLETSLALGIMSLVNAGHLTYLQLMEKMSVKPAELYNLDTANIAEGKPADIVIFDPNEKWIAGDYASKAENTPFTGMEMTGKVKYTICNGRIAYEDK